VIRESGAVAGQLVYVRSSRGVLIEGARLTTSPDLLHLKADAIQSDEPLVAVGPATDESYADFVIDADLDEPVIVKSPVGDDQTQVRSGA
jgi:hypothetical protein